MEPSLATNRKQRKANELKARVRATRKLFAALYPNTFCGFGEPKKPLKIYIIDDIAKDLPEIPLWVLGATMRDYCKSPSYQAAVAAGGPRYDLAGNPVGQVSEAHRAHAAAMLLRYPSEVVERWRGRKAA